MATTRTRTRYVYCWLFAICGPLGKNSVLKTPRFSPGWPQGLRPGLAFDMELWMLPIGGHHKRAGPPSATGAIQPWLSSDSRT
jgi:hypothetical protein